MDRNKSKKKKIKRLDKVTNELDKVTNELDDSVEEENNQIEKTPFQKLVLYVYIAIIIGIFLLGVYVVYKYIYKNKNTSNIVGGSIKKIEKISDIDRKSINDLLDKFID